MDKPEIDIARLSAKGQLVIPAPLREKLGLKKGSRVLLTAFDDAIVLQKVDALGDRMRARDVLTKVIELVSKIKKGA